MSRKLMEENRALIEGADTVFIEVIFNDQLVNISISAETALDILHDTENDANVDVEGNSAVACIT